MNRQFFETLGIRQNELERFCKKYNMPTYKKSNVETIVKYIKSGKIFRNEKNELEMK